MLDYNDLYDIHLAEQEAKLARFPKCDSCGKTIQDDFLYDIHGDIYCEDCMREEFMRYVEDYIKD